MPDDRTPLIKLMVQIFVSGAVLLVSLYVILSNSYPDSYAKWAFGMVGLVLGYWLR